MKYDTQNKSSCIACTYNQITNAVHGWAERRRHGVGVVARTKPAGELWLGVRHPPVLYALHSQAPATLKRPRAQLRRERGSLAVFL